MFFCEFREIFKNIFWQNTFRLLLLESLSIVLPAKNPYFANSATIKSQKFRELLPDFCVKIISYFQKQLILKTLIKAVCLARFTHMILQPWSMQKKVCFPLRTSAVNMNKSAVSCGFGHIY